MKFTIEQLEAMDPCAEALAYARQNADDFARGWQECERSDWMLWFLSRKELLDKPTSVRLACAFAKHVLPIFERKYPNDKRPREAIAAARKWLREPTEENRVACREAAWAAWAAEAAGDAGAAEERKWQSAQIHKLVPNPFGKPKRTSKRTAKGGAP